MLLQPGKVPFKTLQWTPVQAWIFDFYYLYNPLHSGVKQKSMASIYLTGSFGCGRFINVVWKHQEEKKNRKEKNEICNSITALCALFVWSLNAIMCSFMHFFLFPLLSALFMQVCTLYDSMWLCALLFVDSMRLCALFIRSFSMSFFIRPFHALFYSIFSCALITVSFYALFSCAIFMNSSLLKFPILWIIHYKIFAP